MPAKRRYAVPVNVMVNSKTHSAKARCEAGLGGGYLHIFLKPRTTRPELPIRVTFDSPLRRKSSLINFLR